MRHERVPSLPREHSPHLPDSCAWALGSTFGALAEVRLGALVESTCGAVIKPPDKYTKPIEQAPGAHIALHGKRSEREATHETTSLLPPQRKQASGERAQASGERRSARSVFASFRIPTSSIGEDDGVLKAKEAVAVCAFACLSCVRVMLLGISVSITRIKVCEAEGSSGRFRGVVKRCKDLP